MSRSNGKNWEGLGGPIRYNTSRSDSLSASNDPTLDACCQRELEEQHARSVLRSTLQQYDVVAERERRRRHSVLLKQSNGGNKIIGIADKSNNCNDRGCRCSYDPNTDGGEYHALSELRRIRQQYLYQHQQKDEVDNEDDDEKKVGEHRYHDKSKSNAKTSTNTNTNTTIHGDNNDNDNDNHDNDDDSDDEYNYLLDEDLPTDTAEDIKMYEERRRMELEWELLQNEIAVLHGYGIHRQIHPQRVFVVAGLLHSTSHGKEEVVVPNAVVLHLVDADSMVSASLDLYLEQLAMKYRGTMFLRSNGRASILLHSNIMRNVLPMFHNATPTSVDNDLPALVAIRNGVAVNACLQLREFRANSNNTINNQNDEDDIDPSTVFHWLDQCDVLHVDRPTYIDQMCRIRPEQEALWDSCTSSNSNIGMQHRPEVLREEERYDCGRDGCNKSFPHQHIGGDPNEKQDGLLVSEAEILDNGN